MFRHFRTVSATEGVTNAAWTLDLSTGIQTNSFVQPQLRSGDDQVDWLMFNIFHPTARRWRCRSMRILSRARRSMGISTALARGAPSLDAARALGNGQR